MGQERIYREGWWDAFGWCTIKEVPHPQDDTAKSINDQEEGEEMTKPKKERNMARVNFDVDPALFERLKKLPWGFRTTLIRVLLEKVADAVDKHGEIMIGAILSGEFELVHVPKERGQNLPGSHDRAAQ